MTKTVEHDTSTTDGCGQILGDLRRQLRAHELRQKEIDVERDRLALPAALKRDEALQALRELAEEEAMIAASSKNLAAAIREAERLHGEAKVREERAEKESRFDRGAALREELFEIAEEFDAALETAAEILKRHDRVATELAGLRLIGEGAATYLAQGAGIEGALLSAGFGPSVPSISRLRTASGPLAKRHREMVGFPSRDHFIERMP